jgi:hypothetical protein
MIKNKKLEKAEIKLIPFRKDDSNRVYSNHVEINVSEIDLNIKFCDVRPPENNDDIEKIVALGTFKIPIVSEIVIPLVVAKELKRILNEKIAEE